MVNLLIWLLLLHVWVRSVDSLTHRSTVHGLLHLLHLHLLRWLVWIVIVLGHGSSLHRLILLLLLILVQVDSLCVGHLLLVVDLCGDTIFIVILILEVARTSVLHVLALNEVDVQNSENDEDRAQNGQGNGIFYIMAMAKQSCDPETSGCNDYKVDIEALAAPLGLFRSQLSTVYFSLAVLRTFYTADCE